MNIHHLNCGVLHAPPSPPAACHCLLLEHGGRLALVDTGIGLADIAHPVERIGQSAIDGAGFQFHEHRTAARQIERLGFSTAAVTDIVLTHADPDHAGGLADFPDAAVHLSAEEFAQLGRGNWRYAPAQFAHEPRWVTHAAVPDQASPTRWFGLEARALPLALDVEAVLVPLVGHTAGHCGVAVHDGSRWLLHVGDAYYLRVELSTDEHPVSQLATMRAENDSQRRASLHELRRLARDHANEIEMFGYHDLTEFPNGVSG
ncbi:MBL fold metallo-hydrolase [Gemmatimonas groenlandica]|uniref:MBL fold metallo-hydrolase n=1 Tax=Gemmatimonas groenlandica TaxID=2732249 RepID=A0A6M4IY56_9BACT|nr:MBL fold metallo-hydrolase [Gemmatimonas groenlandica]QJR37181.1 MBL fold metallo-hydrolase [Gemmatimonas groenlandica]